jgi:predicted nucleic acid-binding protein
MEYIDVDLIKEAAKAVLPKLKVVEDDDDPAILDAANEQNANALLANGTFASRRCG